MGNFEKLGVLVIIILVAVLFVIVIFGGAPQEGLFTNEVPSQLSATGQAGGTALPAAGPERKGAAEEGPGAESAPWPPAGEEKAEEKEEKKEEAAGAEGAGTATAGEVETTPAPVPEYLEHVVKPHETYWKISRLYYGSNKYVGLIRKANPSVDPLTMPVGLKLRIPNPERVLAPGETPGGKPPVAPPARPDTYTVKKGETLITIARRVMGPNANWRKLYQANRDRIGPDPDDLSEGMTLVIPH